MPRSPGNTLRVRGPFLGLDEKTDPTILGPQYATSLSNVLLDRGKIEPRGGLKRARTLSGDPLPRVRQLVHVAVGSDGTANVVISVTDRGIHVSGGPVVSNGADNGMFVQGLLTRGSIVPFFQHVYFMFGGGRARGSLRIWHRGGTNYELDFNDIGIAKPSEVVQSTEPLDTNLSLLGWPIGTFKFALSLARIDEEGTLMAESNREIADLAGEEELEVAADEQVLLGVRVPGGVSLDAWNHFKLYVKTLAFPAGVDFAEETTYRLAAIISRDSPFVTSFEPEERTRFEIRLTEGAAAGLGLSELLSPVVGAPLSTVANGPFAPTQNGQPPAARIATAYQDMMMYASVERGTKGLLFYSEPNNPNHVAGTDFIGFGDRVSTDLSALVVYQGRLIVFKETEIHVVAGTILRRTNADAALEVGVAATFQVFKAVDGIGCANTDGGVGALECDGILYFNGADGIYAFNGLSAVKVSGPLDTRFSWIPVDLRNKCTMANDTENGLLWIYYAHPDVVSSMWTMLCYDYRQKDPRTGLGRWTVHNFGDTLSIGLLSITSTRPIADEDPIDVTHKDFVGGTVDGRIVYSKREQPSDDGTTILWNYTTAPLDLGLAERNKRFHYLSIEHTMEEGPINGYLTVQTERGERTVSFSFPAASSRVKKIRIGSRGSRVTVRFSGIRHTVNINTPAVNGFAIDAEPIGHR